MGSERRMYKKMRELKERTKVGTGRCNNGDRKLRGLRDRAKKILEQESEMVGDRKVKGTRMRQEAKWFE